MKKIPKNVIDAEKLPAFSRIEKIVFSLPLKDDGSRDMSSNKQNPYVVLKYFLSRFECFSNWTPEELSMFSAFLNKIQRCTWEDVRKSKGFKYTEYDIKAMKSGQKEVERLKNDLSEDIDFFELRVNHKIRIHGFRMLSAFFLVLLDREHRVFPEK